MAEILIQRKRRRSVWPWLLSLLVLALLPLPFIGRGQSDETRLATAQRDTTARPDTSALRDSAAVGGDSGALADAASGAPGSSSAPAATGQAPGGQVTSAERTTATAAGAIAPAERGPVPSNRPAGAAAGASSGRESFREFVATTAPTTTERAHREYTAEALRLLADDLRALGATEGGVSIIRVHADSLRLPSARSGARPDWARAAFLGAVRELDLLRGQQRARIDIGRLRSTAWAINPRRSLLSQRATVDRFFAAARDALDSLSRRG